MGISIPALVNPPLLAWAREESGHASETVARRLHIKPDRLLAWERGERKPTVRQARQLAKLYHRPLGVFFLPHPPILPPLAAEYRRLPGVEPGIESPELRLALRVMLERRDTMEELGEEMGAPRGEFSLPAHLAQGAPEVGRRLREALGISVSEQLAWKSEWQAWRRWREAVESLGVLVFQFPQVPLQQIRGVSLLKFPLPVIGINSKESAAGARVFTLLHELVHVALAYAKEESPASRETRSGDAWQEIERFAEEAASAALIPEAALNGFLSRMDVPRDGWDLHLVRQLAAKFRVTPLAMATRLRAAGALTWEAYRRWRTQWNDYLANLPKRAGGFATPVEKCLGRGGRPFARLVLEAMDANRITGVAACHQLGLRFDQLEELRHSLRGGAGGDGSRDGGD